MINKKDLKKESEENKKFNYEKDGTKLNFTLRTDIKKQLSNFKEILVEALSDVEAQLKKFKK